MRESLFSAEDCRERLDTFQQGLAARTMVAQPWLSRGQDRASSYARMRTSSRAIPAAFSALATA
jgi:hypothetical protein